MTATDRSTDPDMAGDVEEHQEAAADLVEAQDGSEGETNGQQQRRRRANTDERPLMVFDRVPVTVEAKALVAELVTRFNQHEKAQGKRQRARRQQAEQGLIRLVEQFAGELVAAVDSDTLPDLPCHKNVTRLIELGVKTRVFDQVYKGLLDLGLFEVASRGSYMRFDPIVPDAGSSASDLYIAPGGSQLGAGKGKATRIRPTEAFRQLVRQHRIKASAAVRHFPRRNPPPPIQLRGRSIWAYGEKRSGRLLKVARTPETARLKAEVEKLSAFIRTAKVEGVEGIELTGWTRIFNQGDEPGFAWNRGGRLYARPGDASYQSLSQEERGRLRIDGEAVVEIDIRSSHLAIVYAVRGQCLADQYPAVDEPDPYQIGALPRPVVKAWVTITLGAGAPPKRWPRQTIAAMKDEDGIDLSKYRPAEVGGAILARHPILRDLTGISWAKLQFIESQAILATMLRLKREHSIPALPVHDSLIVARSAYWVAELLLAQELKAATGQRPLELKPSVSRKELPAPKATPYWPFLQANLWDF